MQQYQILHNDIDCRRGRLKKNRKDSRLLGIFATIMCQKDHSDKKGPLTGETVQKKTAYINLDVSQSEFA